MNEISLIRLYLLRALYLLIIVGLGIVVWPGIIHHEKPWELMEGVVQCMLAAFSALSVLGLLYPLQMLPLLLWELAWKSIWLIIVALPLWYSGQMDESTWSTASSCLIVVIFPFFIPWRFVFTHYVKKRADRWH
ncbi:MULTISPECIES: hypothetical protein [unclassified Paenibacillus]|uniref:hypothetical protein n=1 Tax=unclassified Paenibacillus TaxID=185978 RepID=UPI00070941D1|nr:MULTISPECIES: hypothetical protein [unclassified Paenibacillus]KQX68203.1 hypothetical protein ASD40_25335 [Paenibacillus sp. Root444D2]KRE48935.1 hypothetical protein ASG85_25850 [Paenibacillus sp. Soil724D2]